MPLTCHRHRHARHIETKQMLSSAHVQIQQALHGAGGELGAARAACAAVAAAAQQQQQQGREAQSAFENGPAGSLSQRHWWPQSPFCHPAAGAGTAAAGPAATTSTAAPTTQPPRLVPHHLPQPVQRPQQAAQAGMQPAAAAPQRASATSSRGTVAASSSSTRQSPAAVTLRRLLGPAAGSSGGSGGGSTAPRQPGILTRSAGARSSGASLNGSSSSASRPPGTAGTAAGAAGAAARQREALHPHYAAVFLTDRSREQLLQHVAPLHESISADHMTMAYKPSLQQCCGLPLGREAALFIVGVAADYRAQVGMLFVGSLRLVAGLSQLKGGLQAAAWCAGKAAAVCEMGRRGSRQLACTLPFTNPRLHTLIAVSALVRF